VAEAGAQERGGDAADEAVVEDDDADDAVEEAPAPARRRSRKAAVAEPSAAEAVEEKPARRRRRSRQAVEPEAPARAERPARRRQVADRQVARPVVRAQAKYVKSSARKARLVCDNIRGKSVVEARAILAHTPRAVARDWSKLLESAVANAEHNHELVGEDLYVKAVHADEGPTAKRFRPRALGRATRIRKRTAHLTILLTPKD
jgi:ribosomal protein L22